jgi:NADPH-dependent glutamate synthase beta subunit-like oxidoreductase
LGQNFHMFAPRFLQNSCDSSCTRKGTDVPATIQNLLKGVGLAADPFNWTYGVAQYEVVFT